MCNGPWKDHGAQYYECSKYKEDETVGDVQEQVAIAWTLLKNLAILLAHLRTWKRLIQEYHYQNIFIIFNDGRIIVEV